VKPVLSLMRLPLLIPMHHLLLLPLLLLLLIQPFSAVGLELTYTVTLEDLATRTLQVELEIAGWPQSELNLQSVPTYMDNPTAAVRGRIVRRLVARDTEGDPMVFRVKDGEHGEPIFFLKAAPDTLLVSYDLLVDFVPSRQTEDYPIQLPFMDQERAWLYGNYVFCYPVLASRKSVATRIPVRTRVQFVLPENVPLVGPPSNQLELANLYALMSLQFGFGAFLVAEDSAGGYPFSIVTPDSLAFTPAEQIWLRERTREIVTSVTDFFGGDPFPSMSFFYFRGEGIGGLEGAYACQTFVPASIDVSAPSDEKGIIFATTALHEFFHTWNPIGVFAAGDPWIKEGVTTYYGQVLACRLGWLKPESWQTWQSAYEKLLRENPLFTEVALDDPQIWDREYDSEDWRTLTYDRGLAVTLLLDVRIREATGNRKSLDDVWPLLFRQHRHGSYSHAELLTAIKRTTGFDASRFFAVYVEGMTPPSAEEVVQALVQAEQFDVFTPRHP